MRQLSFYKPVKNFPQRKGAAFQFKPATKRTSKGDNEPCIWVEAVPQSKDKPPQRAAKTSAFVWDESKIIFCLSIVDLGKLSAFFKRSASIDSARFIMNALHENNEKFNVSIPDNRVELVHQTEDPQTKKPVTKGFKLHYPAGHDKDVELVITSNKGIGHSLVKTFLKPEECALLSDLVGGIIFQYYFTDMTYKKIKD